MALLFEPLQLHRAEEYLTTAVAPAGTPVSLLRPPGYVAFLHFIQIVAGGIDAASPLPVYLAQAVVLGLATVAWFSVTRRWLTSPQAWLMALGAGCHPLSLILVGYVHYDNLHTGLVVFLGLLLVKAFAAEKVSLRWAALAGLGSGLTTLTRPMTLVLPAFVAVSLWALRDGALSGRRWRAWVVFSVLSVVTIAPRTWNNYLQTGRFIPVNAQTMAAFWPMFETELRPNSDNFPWIPLWFSRGYPLLAHRLGAERASAATVDALALEDVLRERVHEIGLKNLGRYLGNCVGNAWFFISGDSRQFIRAFIFYQDDWMYFLPASWGILFFVAFSALLNATGLAGLALGVWRRDATMLVLAALFVCLWAVHSALYLDYRYIYIKFPFLMWFTAYLVSQSGRRWPDRASAVTKICAAFTFLSFLGSTLLVW